MRVRARNDEIGNGFPLFRGRVLEKDDRKFWTDSTGYFKKLVFFVKLTIADAKNAQCLNSYFIQLEVLIMVWLAGGATQPSKRISGETRELSLILPLQIPEAGLAIKENARITSLGVINTS